MKRAMSNTEWLGVLLLLTGFALLAIVSWQIALGVFLFNWGNNLIIAARVRDLISLATGRRV